MPEEAGQERTEKPTTKRLQKARSQGSVPTSQEMLSAISLITLTVVTVFCGPRVVQWSIEQMKQGFSCDVTLINNTQTFSAFVNSKIAEYFYITAPFLIALMITGYVANVSISGRNFTTKALKWKFNSINPATGLKGLFSVKSLVKLILAILKIIFVGAIVYNYLRGRIKEIAVFQWIWAPQMLKAFSTLILGVLIRLCIALLILGIIDLLYQKWKYIKDLMMTKKEVQDERKDADTPPKVKRKIRQKQFEMHMQRMLQAVPKANVVIVNPTHFAVALQYDPKTMMAPIVVAKGKNHLCEKIKDIARAYGVPIIRRPALARELYSTADIDHPIPDSLFVAVAEVLALIHRLRHSMV